MKTETGVDYEPPPVRDEYCNGCYYLLTELDESPCSQCTAPTFELFVRRTTEEETDE